MDTLLLGLIGDNIASSQAPRLHGLAGKLTGLNVRYDLLVPRELGMNFDQTFAHCAENGYRGLNITYPYKELAAAKVTVTDPLVRAVRAVNTVVFEPGGPIGYNTDYSGFVAAYRAARGHAPAGRVCMAGAGGVGKAIAFGLVRLGLRAIAIYDREHAKAHALAQAVAAALPGLPATATTSVEDAAEGAEGLVNCTPVGMVGHPGTPLPRAAMRGATWAFDAVYTPRHTQFLADAGYEQLDAISGYELFFHQGVHAWRCFSDRALDEKALRTALEQTAAGRL